MSLQSYLTAWLKVVTFQTPYLRLLVKRVYWRIYNMVRSGKKKPTYINYRGPPFISMGGSGLVFKLSDTIAVKKSRKGQSEYIRDEQKIFAILNRQPLSPYIIQDFHHTPEAIFLEYMPGRCLHSLISAQQTRDGWTVVRVERLPAEQDCLRWMRQVAAAAAWLENLGLAHCDIRPANILLSGARNAKLADFGNACEIGNALDGVTGPFGRSLGEEAGEACGTYGEAGSRTEQFAIGSTVFTLTRGYEPYENENWGRESGPICADKLEKMEFPALGSNKKFDGIIDDCWHGRYESIAQLSDHFASLDQCSSEVMEPQLSASDIEARKHECEELVRNGIFEKLSLSI
ncbi:hypothetical protein E4U53_008204 [Claviceps sorghi]|nr:hypothetical protein E4U53_008204 [Claviceps sorghi]